jgi:hypothetical protein
MGGMRRRREKEEEGKNEGERKKTEIGRQTTSKELYELKETN